MRRRVTDWLQYFRDCGYVAIGPLVITTRKQHKAQERNAFEIGAELQRRGLLGQKSTA